MSNDDECLKGFRCVDFFRKIKDEISAELNAMTPEERHLYFERIHQEAVQRRQGRDNEKVL